MDDGRADSGLDWGFEMESIISEIIGDGYEIEEEKLVDLLMQREELQTLIAQFAEFIIKIPELRKEFGEKGRYDMSKVTTRDEIKILLNDLTNGVYHTISHSGANRKFEKDVIYHNGKFRTFIRRITDEYKLR